MLTNSESDRWVLEFLGREEFRMGFDAYKFSTQDLIDQLKQFNVKVITIAGTNGKGETAFFLAEMFKAHHISYCLFTSPHIQSVRERFQNFQGQIQDKKLLSLFQKNQNFLGRLSFFEYLFRTFLDWVLLEKPQFVILEVGLGGRLDATNTIDTDCAVLTSISRDHQEILGHTYRQILIEKLNICRTRGKLFSSLQLNYLIELTHEFAQKLNLDWQNDNKKYPTFKESNLNLAKIVFNSFFPEIKINESDYLIKIFEGRGELLSFHSQNIEFYGSHNPDGMRKLIEKLVENKCHFDYVIVSFSKRTMQDIQSMIGMIKLNDELWDKIYLTRFHHEKAIDLDSFDHDLEIIEWQDFLINNKDRKLKILVTGSYYFVGSVKNFIITRSSSSSLSSC